MDAVTHALACVTIGRAGLAKTTRLAMPMLIVAGVAADADWLSAYWGPASFLKWHRTATDSLIGAAVIAVVTAALFTLWGRRRPSEPVRFWRALVVCGAAATTHVLLDLTNSYGVKLLWPFRQRWLATDLLAPLDIWLLGLLAFGALVPWIFRLATEEIGAKANPAASPTASIVLGLAMFYVGWRWQHHEHALALLRSRLFHGETPLTVGAFPQATALFSWAGVVDTQNTLQTLSVPLLFPGEFDPLSARVFYKPDPSAALNAARATKTAATFLSFARFPWAEVEKTDRGFRVVLMDMRFDQELSGSHRVSAVIELNGQSQVVNEELRFGSIASESQE
jgi:inner membrane protein